MQSFAALRDPDVLPSISKVELDLTNSFLLLTLTTGELIGDPILPQEGGREKNGKFALGFKLGCAEQTAILIAAMTGRHIREVRTESKAIWLLEEG